MPTYRKKPVEIQAMQWDGTARGAGAIIDWTLERNTIGTPSFSETNETVHKQHPELHIPTLDSGAIAAPGDWVLIGTVNELYPCRADIFDTTYELVEAPELTAEERSVVARFKIHEEDE